MRTYTPEVNMHENRYDTGDFVLKEDADSEIQDRDETIAILESKIAELEDRLREINEGFI